MPVPAGPLPSSKVVRPNTGKVSRPVVCNGTNWKHLYSGAIY